VNGTTVQREDVSLVRDIVYVLFKWKVVVLTFTIVGVATILYGVLTAEPSYEALARVYVKRIPQGYVMPAESRSALKRAEVINSELSIIQSYGVAATVIDSLDLAGNSRGLAIERMLDRIKAESPPDADVIDITVRDPEPEMAAAIVNTALDAYLDIRKNVVVDYEAVGYLAEQAGIMRARRDSVAQRSRLTGGREATSRRGGSGRWS